MAERGLRFAGEWAGFLVFLSALLWPMLHPGQGVQSRLRRMRPVAACTGGMAVQGGEFEFDRALSGYEAVIDAAREEEDR